MNRLTLALAGVLALAGALLLSPGAVLAQNCSGTPAANTVCAGPASGAAGFPSFRAPVAADLPAGVPTNTLRTIVANDSVATTDCGKTLQLGTGSTGFFTLTVPAVGSFNGTCRVDVTNGDTASGKAISGLSGLTKLYPTQTFVIEIVNGAWAITQLPKRWVVTGNTTVFVNKDTGADTNGCLASTSACATSAQAMQDIARSIDNQGIVKIKYGCTSTPCTYSDVPFDAQNYVGTGRMIIEGDTSTPDNFVMTCSAACTTGLFRFTSGSTTQYLGGIWTVQGFKTTSAVAGVYGIFNGQASAAHIYFQSMDFGSLSNTGFHFGCSQQGQIDSLGTYTISGGGAGFADSEDGCVMHLQTVATVTGTPACAVACLNAHGAGAIIGTNSSQFSGAATGLRAFADYGGLIDTAGTCNSLPGNQACKVGGPGGMTDSLQHVDLRTTNTGVTGTAHAIVIPQGTNTAPTTVGPCNNNVPITGTGATTDPQCGGTIPVANGGTGDTGTAWSTYTPTISCGAGSLTSATATGRFKTLGKTVFVQIVGTITTNGTCSGRIDLTLPVSAVAATKFVLVGLETGVTNKQLQGLIGGSGAGAANVRFYDGTYPGADGAVVVISGVYESS